MLPILKLMLVGVLATNTTLGSVADYRSIHGTTAHNITKNHHDYQCLIAVPYGYSDLIDSEVYIKVDGRVIGPFLVVDVEQEEHSRIDGGMVGRGVAADTNCDQLYHEWVSIYKLIRQRTPTVINGVYLW